LVELSGARQDFIDRIAFVREEEQQTRRPLKPKIARAALVTVANGLQAFKMKHRAFNPANTGRYRGGSPL
jgi:hypothetical protein